VEGIRYKIADYFVKPVEIEDLVNSINLNLKLTTRRGTHPTSLGRATSF
jgi:hypothetical protein